MQRGVDVSVATTDADGRGILPVTLGELSEWRSIPVRFFPRISSESYKFSPALARWLEQAVGTFDIVHIHAIFCHSSVAAARACIRQNIPYVLRPLGSLDSTTISRHSFRKKVFHYLWGKEMLRNSSAMHYSTDRERLQVEVGFSTGKGFVLPPGIAHSTDYENKSRSKTTARAPLPASPYVLFVGRLHPIKRLELLIDAFSQLPRTGEFRQWSLVIAGDGEPGYVETLKRHASSTVNSEKVFFCGWLNGAEKLEALADAEIFALTSRHENFGLAAAEAMMMGVPVLVTEDVFLADLIRECDTGWVAGRKSGELRDTLREAMLDPEARHRKGLAGRQVASSQFELGKTTRRLLEVYESIIAPGAGAHCH